MPDPTYSGFFAPLGDQPFRQASLFGDVAPHESLSRCVEPQPLLVQVQDDLISRPHGMSLEEVLDEYEGLVPEDIRTYLLFAGKSLESSAFMPLVAGPE